MPGKTFGSRKPYLSIIGGNLKQSVSKETEGAVKREYQLKDGTEKVKYELTFAEWSGRILDLNLKDGQFGETLEVVFEDAIITIPVKSRYFDDFMMKLPALNINQTITFHPYDFESDGKQKKGVSVSQNGKKITSYYWNETDEKNCNGLPVPKENAKKTYKKSDWELYFLTRTQFLKDSLDKIKENMDSSVAEESMEEPDEIEEDSRDDEIKLYDRPEDVPSAKKKKKDEINVDDVPF